MELERTPASGSICNRSVRQLGEKRQSIDGNVSQRFDLQPQRKTDLERQ
jgi:hypothetical protein